MILIRDATTLTTDGITETNVLVGQGRVLAVGHVRPDSTHRVVDGSGLILGPGLVDLHVHLREPGDEHKEDLASGARAAAAGGYTAIVAMPNTRPACDNRRSVEAILNRARTTSAVAVFPAGAVTVGRDGVSLTDLEGLYRAGVRLFTDDGDPIADPAIMRTVLEASTTFDCFVVAQHAEDRAMAPEGHLHDGEVALRMGIAGLPSASETSMIARDIELAAETSGSLHIQHVSTAGGVDLIAAAKANAIDVTAEVTPHHLSLTEEDAGGGDPNFKMYPPLREETDRKALGEGLRSGVIDMVATDHAPHTDAEKSVGIVGAPRGVIGLETALAITGSVLDWDVAALFDRMSTAPANRIGLDRHGRPIRAGNPANLVLIDPARKWRPDSFESRSRNSPFQDVDLVGRAVMTIYEGNITWEAST